MTKRNRKRSRPQPQRKQGVARTTSEPSPPPETVGASRVARAKRRARRVEIGIGLGAGALFIGSATLAHSYAQSHPRAPMSPLAAPRKFQAAVKKSFLAAGQIAPPEAPPQVSAGAS
jgi:hypothetical protein